MQHLTRRKHESIMIGDDVEITVLEIEGDQVKLTINAPNELDIHESELYVKREWIKHRSIKHSQDEDLSEAV